MLELSAAAREKVEQHFNFSIQRNRRKGSPQATKSHEKRIKIFLCSNVNSSRSTECLVSQEIPRQLNMPSIYHYRKNVSPLFIIFMGMYLNLFNMSIHYSWKMLVWHPADQSPLFTNRTDIQATGSKQKLPCFPCLCLSSLCMLFLLSEVLMLAPNTQQQAYNN